jgi:hypothetical protein
MSVKRPWLWPGAFLLSAIGRQDQLISIVRLAAAMMNTAAQIRAIEPTRSKGDRREFKAGAGGAVITVGGLSAMDAVVKRVICRGDEWSLAISEPGGFR